VHTLAVVALELFLVRGRRRCQGVAVKGAAPELSEPAMICLQALKEAEPKNAELMKALERELQEVKDKSKKG